MREFAECAIELTADPLCRSTDSFVIGDFFFRMPIKWRSGLRPLVYDEKNDTVFKVKASSNSNNG